MSRPHSVLGLSLQHHATVEACIRRSRYVDILGMVAELKDQGIVMSKSALHRYVVKLKARDGMHAGTSNDVVVVIVERSTGETTTMTTGASRAALVGLIEELNKRLADFPVAK